MSNYQDFKKYPLEHLKVSDLIDDPENPNELSDSKYAALIQSLKHFGELDPIVVREHNKMIIDGHHRVKAYKDCNVEYISAYLIPATVTEAQIKLMRQALNKIHGEHNPKKDYDELFYIMNSKEQKDKELLNIMFQIDQNKMMELNLLMDQPKKEDWENMLNRQVDPTNATNSHKIVLMLSDIEFDLFNDVMENYRKLNIDRHKELRSNTDVIMSILNDTKNNLKVLEPWKSLKQQEQELIDQESQNAI